MSSLLKLESTQCIWDKAPHNAFTDLVYYKGVWYCAFREASSHMSLDGKVRILKSSDGVDWVSWQLLDWQGGDVRDPRFAVSSDDTLLISVGIRAAVPTTKKSMLLSVSWLLENEQLSGPFICQTSEGTWRWAPSWGFDRFYSIGYAGRDLAGCLYQSKDGRSWSKHVDHFFPESPCFSNESSLVFSKNQTAYCLLRRDRAGCNALLGSSVTPFKDWTWIDLGMQIGGPKLIQLDSGQLIATFRVINDDRAYTAIYLIEPDGKLTELIQLPSGGDTSYAGMVEYKSQLWISYYSSHEDKVAIYLSKINLCD